MRSIAQIWGELRGLEPIRGPRNIGLSPNGLKSLRSTLFYQASLFELYDSLVISVTLLNFKNARRKRSSSSSNKNISFYSYFDFSFIDQLIFCRS